MPCSLLSYNRSFGGKYRLHLQGRRNNISKNQPASNFFDREDGGDSLLRNVGCNSTGYTASYPRRWYSSCIRVVWSSVLYLLLWYLISKAPQRYDSAADRSGLCRHVHCIRILRRCVTCYRVHSMAHGLALEVSRCRCNGSWIMTHLHFVRNVYLFAQSVTQ
jgi:hypothetical protein